MIILTFNGTLGESFLHHVVFQLFFKGSAHRPEYTCTPFTRSSKVCKTLFYETYADRTNDLIVLSRCDEVHRVLIGE